LSQPNFFYFQVPPNLIDNSFDGYSGRLVAISTSAGRHLRLKDASQYIYNTAAMISVKETLFLQKN